MLPLNFEPSAALQETADDLNLEWLPHEEAVQLRSSPRPVIVAWTKVLSLWLGRDGRGVIVFHDGHLVAEWFGNQVFERRRAAQQKELQRLKARGLTLP